MQSTSSPALECAVLTGLSLHHDRAAETLAELRPDCFTGDVRQTVFAVIADLVRAGRKADFLSVQDDHRISAGAIDRARVAESVSSTDCYPPNLIPYARALREKADLRALVAAHRRLGSLLENPEDRTAAQITAEYQSSVLALATNPAGGGLAHVGKGMAEHLERMAARAESEHGIKGFPTRFVELDRKLSGLQRKKVHLIAGRPGMGKSAFAMNLLEDIARYSPGEGRVLLFTLEMDREEMVDRLLGAIAGVDSDVIRSGRLNDREWDEVGRAATWLENSSIEIDDSPGLDLGTLTARVHQARARGRLAAVAVDYLGLMELEEKRGENTATSLARLSKGIKRLAKSTDTVVVLLAQLNRKLEDRDGDKKRPRMADLRDSGGLEQDADVIIFPHRPERFDDDPVWKGFVELIVEKQRGGPTGIVPAGFEGSFFRFIAEAPPAALARFNAPKVGRTGKGQSL